MATGFLVASAAIGMVGSVSQRNAAKRAAEEAKRLGFANAEAQRKETAEAIKRTQKEQKSTEGQISANIGASGFAVGSSLDQYLESVKEDHASDIDWMRTSGASRAAIMERETEARYSASRAQATGQFISGMSQSIGQLGAAGSQYKKTGWGF